MSISRSIKSHGGTNYLANTDMIADENDIDLIRVVNLLNGELKDENFDPAGTPIAVTKFAAYANSAANAVADLDPGSSALPVVAAELTGEIKALRRVLQSRGYGSAARYIDASGVSQKASYLGFQISSRNLIRGANMEAQTGGAGTAPDGWTLVGAPSTVELIAPTADAGKGKALRVISGAAAREGISQQVDDIRANTLYIVGMVYKQIANPMRLETVGGIGSGNAYQDLALDSGGALATFSTLSGLVKSDSSGSPVTVSVLTNGNFLDEYELYKVYMYPLSDLKTRRNRVALYKEATAEQPYTSGRFALTGVSLTFTPSSPRMRIKVIGILCISTGIIFTPNELYIVEGSTDIAGPALSGDSLDFGASSFGIQFEGVRTFTPGSPVTYSLEFSTDFDGGSINPTFLGRIAPSSITVIAEDI